MKLFLSIITPVLNNEQFISKAIENYLSEATAETELIVMDGGSSDCTLEVIQSYAAKHKNIRWISEKDSGQSNAMNKGIQMAKGEYISFLNVDDFYSEGTFRRVFDILKSSPQIDFLVGDCNVWDEHGALIFVNKPSKTEKWHLLSGYHFPVNPTAYFYRKSIHQHVGFYKEDNHYNMDLEFLIQARMHYKFHYVTEIWGNFRMLPNTKTVSEMASHLLEQRKRDLLEHYFKKSNSYLQLRIVLYKCYKVYFPKISFQFRRIVDKIKFELKKLNI
jgi:glycosyltransferase involved in cell wall biosynthesis